VRGSADAAPLLRLAAAKQLAAITVTSSEGGENLMAMLGPDAAVAINGVPMFVPHPRIAARMRALDCVNVIETAGGDAGLLAGLRAYFSRVVA
jgi:uroporphyrinogen-III synthase